MPHECHLSPSFSMSTLDSAHPYPAKEGIDNGAETTGLAAGARKTPAVCMIIAALKNFLNAQYFDQIGILGLVARRRTAPTSLPPGAPTLLCTLLPSAFSQ